MRSIRSSRAHNAFTIAAIHTLAGDARVRVPVPARHGREHLRPGRRQGQARSRRAASTRRSARTRRCSRISCAGCSRTAPTRSFVNRIVDPAVSIASLVVDPVAQAEKTGGAPHAEHPAARGAAAGTRGIRAAPISPTTPTLAALAASAGGGVGAARRGADPRAHADGSASRQPSRRCAIPPIATTSSAR